jgi:glycosyltransferase involved in cell wall biosynthesis
LRAAVSSERSAEIFSFLGEHLIHDKRLVVVMPAYNAERTIAQTLAEIPAGFVDEVILVDDASRDKTTEVARSLGLHTIRHEKNRGYGGNQKTCYRAALERGADIVVMLHPDYQYSPRLVVAMASMIAVDQYDVVLGSRILCGSAIAGGMPIYKYISNRLLTAVQNILISAKLSEYHTGYRGFNRKTL